MAKKDKIEVPNSNSIANKDTLQRLNFLYQASIFMNSLPSSLSSSPERPIETKSGPSNSKKKRSTSSRKRNWSALELSRVYVEDAKAVAQKTTTRM
jgi:ribonuclease P protein subunit RPR2